MSYMFSDNYSSALHDLSAWDTSKVTDMSHMFENNYGVQTRDLSHWDISSVTDMSHMFGNNYNVTAYDLSGWDTHSVTNMSYMFENNYSVNGHNLDGWNTSKVTNMSYIFANNYSARSIDVSNWDTSGVTDMSYMFAENYYIPSLDLSNWDTKSVTNMNSMFYSCHTLAQVGFENWNVRAVDDIGHFLEYTPMKSLDLSKWQFSGDNAYRAFASMSELQAVDISGFDLINAYKYEMLSTLPNLTEITLGENTTLRWSLDQISGKVWQGDLTGHQFGPVYNGGYPDTYRLTEGTLGYYGIDWIDNHNNERISDILLYGKPGETLSLSQVSLPAGYELSDPDEAVQLSEDEDTWTWNDVYLDRVVATTTRTIQFQGLPEGHLKDEVQEIKWHWDRLQGEAIPQNRSLRYYEDVIHLPQGGYDEFIVPQVEGYKADIAVVPLKTFDGEITALPDNETVTVKYTKLDSGHGGDQTTDPTSPGTNTGNGTIGGGQMTNLSTGDSSVAQDKALPQTGSQIASGLTLLGLGLLGLLGFTKRRKRN